MSKANEPAYPTNHEPGTEYADGLSKREKLAMELYGNMLLKDMRTPKDLDAEELLKACAVASLRAADIFFEQLDK